MKLSLELSQRLHEIGVVVESALMYEEIGPDEYTIPVPFVRLKKGWYIPAPTFEELWAVLPIFIEHDGDSLVLHMSKLDGTDGSIEGATTVYYMDWEIIIHETVHAHELPVEAAGMLLIWLAENGHVEVKS